MDVLIGRDIMVALHSSARKSEPFAAIRFVDHPSFHEKNAMALYRIRPDSAEASASSHLPDEVTRELAKGMHYAAYRLREARDSSKARIWRDRYVELRNQIVLGNRKLIYRAVHTRVRDSQLAEDCAAECHVVMIRAVAAYNPWLGIRFSTYAFTCILRELTRLVQRQTKDRLRQAASFDDGMCTDESEPASSEPAPDFPEANVGQFFATEHPLLNDREKQVLSQRFGFNLSGSKTTLKDIGRDLSISKERVRQLQNSGLDKLRDAFAADCVEA